MLKGINKRIQPDLLRALMAMGHGDEIVLADANFPAETLARKTVTGAPLQFGGDGLEALEAILDLLPLDDFAGPAVHTMQVVGEPDSVPVAVQKALPLLARFDRAPQGLERSAFYERAGRAFAVVRTLETLPYGNFILRKGVIASES